MEKRMNYRGQQIAVSLSTRPGKKLKIVIMNPSYKGQKTFHIGAKSYEHYFDKSGLLPTSLNHRDEKRRRNYLSRHKKNIERPGIHPAGLASFLLWSG
jgi:hypothetical protein